MSFITFQDIGCKYDEGSAWLQRILWWELPLFSITVRFISFTAYSKGLPKVTQLAPRTFPK